ncbi:MAG TPA: hypothetical protein VFE19_06280 [Jatrophihabitantaceae bacterium]|jgi:hypothetical protein|nr:hypothetical protein [Jatrophihabitantaceae bacterium]
MTPDLTLPLFVAGREFAGDMADRLGTVTDRSIVVDATGLASGTSSFAAELVHRILVEGKAAELILVGAPAQFVEYAREAAQDDGVTAALQISRELPVALPRSAKAD